MQRRIKLDDAQPSKQRSRRRSEEPLDDLRKRTRELSSRDKLGATPSAEDVYEAAGRGTPVGRCKYLIDPSNPKGIQPLIYQRALTAEEKYMYAVLHNELCPTGLLETLIYAICTSLLVKGWIKQGVVRPESIFYYIWLEESQKSFEAACDRFVSEQWLSPAQVEAGKELYQFKYDRFIDVAQFERIDKQDLFEEIMAKPEVYRSVVDQMKEYDSLPPEDRSSFEYRLLKDAKQQAVPRMRERNKLGFENSRKKQVTRTKSETDDLLAGLEFMDKHGIRSIMDEMDFGSKADDVFDEFCDDCENDAVSEDESVRRILKSLSDKGLI